MDQKKKRDSMILTYDPFFNPSPLYSDELRAIHLTYRVVPGPCLACFFAGKWIYRPSARVERNPRPPSLPFNFFIICINCPTPPFMWRVMCSPPLDCFRKSPARTFFHQPYENEVETQTRPTHPSGCWCPAFPPSSSFGLNDQKCSSFRVRCRDISYFLNKSSVIRLSFRLPSPPCRKTLTFFG